MGLKMESTQERIQIIHTILYMSQKEWAERWKKCCNLDYTPSVNIKVIRDDDNLVKAVAEVTKHRIRDYDYLQGTKRRQINTAKSILNATTDRRLYAFTGRFADIRQQLK